MKISVLAVEGISSFILINWLVDAGYRSIDVVFENPQSRVAIVRHRAYRLGYLTAASQIVFIAAFAPILRWRAKARLEEIMSENALRSDPPDPAMCCYFKSVNCSSVADHLARQNPDVVLVNGTRIIRKAILTATNAPFLNTHAGITPRYRGVHGGYWALWNDDSDNFGVTIHLVDHGVDTGTVLYQARIRPSDRDSFATYPLLQQASSFPGLLSLLQDIEKKKALSPCRVSQTPTRQWYHPTLVQYISGRMRGVR